MSQTSISTTQGRGIAGQLADVNDIESDSAVQAEASAEMPFGSMVASGTSDTDALLPAATSDTLRGVVIHSHQYSKGTAGELGDTGIKPKAQLSLLTRGRILVLVEEAVSKGDRAFIRCGSTGSSAGTQKGAWRKSVETISAVTYTIDATKQCRYLTSASAGGLAVVAVDMINKP